MKFSLSFFSNIHPAIPLQKQYEYVMAYARFADEHDFYGVWLPERHYHPFGGLFPSPAVFASALAVSTTRIKLQAGSIVMPIRSPIYVAEEWAMVDQLSGGRVELSFAPGWNVRDFTAAPDQYAERRTLMWEGIERIQHLWRGTDPQIEVYPKPAQSNVPIYITAASSNETCYRAGKNGYHLLTMYVVTKKDDLREKLAHYYSGLADGGHRKEDKQVTVMLHTYIGPTLKAVEQAVINPFFEYQQSFISLSDSNLTLQDEKELEIAKRLFFKRYSPHHSLLGTPETCKVLIDELAAAGVTQLSCLIDFGMEPELVLEGLQELNTLKDHYQSNARIGN